MANFRQLKCFQAVVELGNFSRAAERLNTSQAGISHAIRDLEEELRCRLFDRTTRRVELTEAGQVFAASALPGLAEIERATTAVRDLGELKKGVVRIAAPPLLGATVLPRLINEVEKEFPSLTLRIEDVATNLVVPRVRNGLCDIGVGTFAAGEEGVDMMRVLRDRLMAFIPPEHSFRLEEEVTWQQLNGERLIVLSRESSIRLLTEMGFEQSGQALRPHLEVHQIGTALSLVENGAGISILPTYAFAAINGRPIIARALRDPVVSRDVNIITARDRTASAATMAVRTILRRVIREMVPEIV
jgi:DNA-binding transcriptional LysR family regulator